MLNDTKMALVSVNKFDSFVFELPSAYELRSKRRRHCGLAPKAPTFSECDQWVYLAILTNEHFFI